MKSRQAGRRFHVGAEVDVRGGVHFRVWAPRRHQVSVVLEAGEVPLKPEDGGYFSGHVPAAAAGSRYRFRLDRGTDLYPDPASRFQPEGPHGPSQVVDPATFPWTDPSWRGITLRGQVIYEMHVGTFTQEGTFAAAAAQLPELLATGITTIELMPIAEFPGRFGWGYDGVNLYAPYHHYGAPDDLRRFVDLAHRTGLGVILDVVYNHLGPDGNYLRQFAEDYFTDDHETDWGQALRFYGDNAGPVREFFIENAAYWIEEFHLDGLRLDATQNIYDRSPDHILAALTRRARQAAAVKDRSIIVVAENEPQHTQLVRPPEQGGHGICALWNDDFHHSAVVALTGHNEAYYTDYLGTPQEFISALKWGYLYQGQRYAWQKKRRGTPALDLHPAHFVTFLENHDQVANSARGQRTHQMAAPGCHRALTALLLLSPGTPMLFQGQEFDASSPFLYFADHHPELAQLVQKGRTTFLRQFPSLATPEITGCLDDPSDPRTFARCKLDLSERQRHAEAYALHRDLLALRRGETAFSAQRGSKGGMEGAVLSPEAFCLRFFGEPASGPDDRLLLVNLGRDLPLTPAPEPLLAPPLGSRWALLWSSEDLRYGGCGTQPCDGEKGFFLPGRAAVVLRPAASPEGTEEGTKEDNDE